MSNAMNPPMSPDGAALHHALSGVYAALLAGDTAGAVALLGPHLARQVPQTAPADTGLVEAATVWARLATTSTTSTDGADALVSARRWAWYGYAASQRLHGRSHWVTLRAGHALAEVLTVRGEHADAADLYAELVAALVSAGERDEASLTAVPLAASLHAAGRCSEAIDHLSQVWDRWRAEHGQHDPRGLPIVVRLAGLLAACDLRVEAGRRWAQAKPALPPDGTPQRVAALVNIYALLAQTDERHPPVCLYRRLRRQRRAGPAAGPRANARVP